MWEGGPEKDGECMYMCMWHGCLHIFVEGEGMARMGASLVRTGWACVARAMTGG